MDFNTDNLYYSAKESAPLNYYGYFANDLASIKKAVTEERQGRKSVYARLKAVLSDTEERRFNCSVGNFALFYAVGDSFNKNIL